MWEGSGIVTMAPLTLVFGAVNRRYLQSAAIPLEGPVAVVIAAAGNYMPHSECSTENLSVVYLAKNAHAPVPVAPVGQLAVETKALEQADLISSCSQSGIAVMILASVIQIIVRYGLHVERRLTMEEASVLSPSVASIGVMLLAHEPE